MKAKAKHKVRQFRVRRLRWRLRDGGPGFKASVLGDGCYLVWQNVFADRKRSSWRWQYYTDREAGDVHRGFPTAAAAKEAAEKDWVVRLSAVLVPVAVEPRKRPLAAKRKEVAR